MDEKYGEEEVRKRGEELHIVCLFFSLGTISSGREGGEERV